ncbi:CPBP family intramembrane metalloprotease [Candidatus Gottesmanbacteria bacterium]|nr:CPBP family intramembrane metalloprotease [Candidatus Gottesmanbacteria bacterium]
MNVKESKQVYILWFVIFIVWSLFRVSFRLPEWVDELLVKPLVFVGPVVWYVYFRERQGIGTLGLSRKNLFHDLYLGIGIGLLFALEGFIANYIKYGNFSFAPILAISGVGLLPFLGLSLATSVSEEILGRGFIYSRLNQEYNNQFKAAFISSVMFLLLHIPILFTQLSLTGPSLIVYLISVFLLGVTNSYLFTLRGNSLVVPILVHLFWNATVALYL